MSKHLQTVAAMACMKSLLMIFNFVFWISGIAILAIGIWMEVELYKYMEMSTEFSGTAPYVLIGTGSLIILIGSLACCCTVKGQPVLLYVYGAFLAIVFVLELGAGISIFAYRNKLNEGFDKGLAQAMANYRNDSTHIVADFDFMQETLHCCGNHGPEDWLNLTPPYPIPLSCCINKAKCDPGVKDQIFSEGCYDKVFNFMNANIGIVAGASVGIAFFPLIGVVLSCCLASVINKAKYEQMA
ncbi:tetraspanin-7 [Tribolium castaneum]|uniref:Tetraspanin n=1 Tax=Tribolium castaneum TaxID=7070 RepID=D6WNZ1_TRICA|nr:PREDICTED: tetraspanin-7 [Tribolium castaneum]EFA04407.1 Tetraspanin-7-like Protein [Tribolium castaneum]|eukprot:XP_974699.3 PREDICTED: tetraspanin-7 [Tribolium castaneum]